MDLSLSDRVFIFAGKVFSLAHWVALDELPCLVETPVAWGTSTSYSFGF
jgi:hypothetical protein